MAAVLKITNGTDSVDLLDTTALYIQNWAQAIARRLPSGDYADVVEIIKLAWMEEDDDTRDSTIQALMQLAGEAWDYTDRELLDQWVWLEARTHSETSSRYAILSEIWPDRLSSRHWGPDGPVDLMPQITREGLWRYTAPNGTPTTAVAATTVYNKQDADGDNFVTIADTDADGDAPGLIIFDQEWDELATDVIVAMKSSSSTSDLNDFIPHLDATLELDNVGSQAADVEAPENIRIDLAAGATLRWTLTAAARKMANYAGDYYVYAVAVMSGGSGTMTFKHGNDYVGLDAVTVNTTASPAAAHFMGRTTIPGGTYNPGLADADYNIKLVVTVAGGGTFRFFDLWLVPISEFAPFVVNNTQPTGNLLTVDGNLERVYQQTSGGAYSQADTTPPEPGGRYLQFKPNRHNRLYFFWTGVNDVAPPNWAIDVTVKIIPRCLAIRGDT